MSTIQSNVINNPLNNTQSNQTQSEEDFDSLVGTREDFLTILIAQLKFQDPLNPMEGTEFIDSIARLSEVEQSINQNARLESIESLLKEENSNFGSPVSYLDKEIEFNSPIIALDNEKATFSYNIDQRPDDVFINISDQQGNVVRRVKGEENVGKATYTWDGRDNSGNKMPDGEYIVSVDYAIGTGDDAKFTSVNTIAKGIVTGANFENGETSLLVGNVNTSVDSIVSIPSRNNI